MPCQTKTVPASSDGGGGGGGSVSANVTLTHVGTGNPPSAPPFGVIEFRVCDPTSVPANVELEATAHPINTDINKRTTTTMSVNANDCRTKRIKFEFSGLQDDTDVEFCIEKTNVTAQ